MWDLEKRAHSHVCCLARNSRDDQSIDRVGRREPQAPCINKVWHYRKIFFRRADIDELHVMTKRSATGLPKYRQGKSKSSVISHRPGLHVAYHLTAASAASSQPFPSMITCPPGNWSLRYILTT